LDDETRVDVEMQVGFQPEYIDRVLFYWQCQQLKEKSNHLGRSIRMNASSKRQNFS